MTFKFTHNLSLPQYKKIVICSRARSSIALNTPSSTLTTEYQTARAPRADHSASSLPTWNLHLFFWQNPRYFAPASFLLLLLFFLPPIPVLSLPSPLILPCAVLHPISSSNIPPLLLGPLLRGDCKAPAIPGTAPQGGPANILDCPDAFLVSQRPSNCSLSAFRWQQQAWIFLSLPSAI